MGSIDRDVAKVLGDGSVLLGWPNRCQKGWIFCPHLVFPRNFFIFLVIGTSHAMFPGITGIEVWLVLALWRVPNSRIEVEILIPMRSTTSCPLSTTIFNCLCLQVNNMMRTPCTSHDSCHLCDHLSCVLAYPLFCERNAPWWYSYPLASGHSLMTLGVPAQNLSNFQMAPIPILSVLPCSTSSTHDILKVSRKIIDHNLPVGLDKCNDWVLGVISCRIYVGFQLVECELSLMAHFFIQYIPLFMIVICWWIGGIEWLKMLWKKSIGKCLFSVKKSFLAPIFAFFTVFYLFPPPNTLLFCYYY